MIVGLTGGIGSGKTLVLKMFEALGAAVYVSDIEAKKLMGSSSKLKSEIKALFGEEAYVNKVLNTTFIGQLVFGDKQKLNALNALIHPKVASHFENFVKEHQKAPYIIYESAILFEQNKQAHFDAVLLVTAPEEVRIQRVAVRDKMKEAEVRQRIQNQWSDEKKIPLADYVIKNTNREETQSKVRELHKIFANTDIGRLKC
jgi:dephospho-CoA kinase